MICTGNICRSPLAHVVFKDCADKAGLSQQFELESAGTHGYHIGQDADHRARKTALKHGIVLSHPARKLEAPDLAYYNFLLCMDNSHLRHVKSMARNAQETDKVRLFSSFYEQAGANTEVPDPYYGDMSDFEAVYQQVLVLSRALLNALTQASKT